MSNPVSARARGLIAREIHSVEQLEVLLLLRATPEKKWTAGTVARERVSAPETAQIRLDDLERRGFIKPRDGGWVYAAPRDVDAALGDLARSYATHPVTVIGLVYSTSP